MDKAKKLKQSTVSEADSDDLFYTCYDALFSQKNYQSEVETILALYKEYTDGKEIPQAVLEIGCGTGSHTQAMAGVVKHIVAIDIDHKMVELAIRKLRGQNIQNVTIKHTKVEQLKENGFDLAIAMFNVVTYLSSQEELISLFKAVFNRLSTHGVFVFDCWNGVASIKDPPREKRVLVTESDKEIECNLSPDIDLYNQKVKLNYSLTVKAAGGPTLKSKYSFSQTLWTPMQIDYALRLAGFTHVKTHPINDLSRHATEKDWKIQFSCS